MAQEFSQDIKRLQAALKPLEWNAPGKLELQQLPIFVQNMYKDMSGLKEFGHSTQRIDAVFQELFSKLSTDGDVYDVTALTNAYQKYKRKYVKQIVFSPEQENLSKFIWNSFRCCRNLSTNY